MPNLFKLLVKDLCSIICFHSWVERPNINVTVNDSSLLANRARQVKVCTKCGKTKIKF